MTCGSGSTSSINSIGIPRFGRTDADIARDAVRALELHGTVPATVQAVVHDGHVTLTGKAGWLYQARDAEQAVRHIKSVRGVFNHIEVRRRRRRAGRPASDRTWIDAVQDPNGPRL